jgi:hypothetical protein
MASIDDSLRELVRQAEAGHSLERELIAELPHLEAIERLGGNPKLSDYSRDFPVTKTR